MSKDSRTWTIERAIPSERGAGRRVLEELLNRFETENWTPRDLFGIRLALEEAIVNAIMHGNRLDRSKQVHVVCKSSAEKVWIKISDEGSGFNPADVPDCTDPDRLAVPSGRGIMLMRNYMTRVEYNLAGNVVVMEKSRPAGS
ncbi:MAG: ATP-binding protein [Planctomycetia bacterium]|nr:ATP-binding protein [Planctomycetia bacterium]